MAGRASNRRTAGPSATLERFSRLRKMKILVIRTFIADPQPAVIASVRPDGQPVSVATWYLLDGEDVLVNMDAGRRRLAYLRADPAGQRDRAGRRRLV